VRQAVGRALLAEVVTLVSPETILAWHRKFVALKWTFDGGARGNAAVMKKITRLVVRMAREPREPRSRRRSQHDPEHPPA
jgi:hypothetical protein